MEVNLALAQIALIFLPGIVWARIDAKYGTGPRPDHTDFLIRAFVFGATTYAVLYFLYKYLGQPFGYIKIARTTEKIDLISLRDEITFSLPLSFFLSIGWLHLVNRKVLMRVLHFIRATRRYGGEDVWTYTFNLKVPNVEYIHLRDGESGCIFAGWVDTFSENEDHREILLRDVIIYDVDGNEASSAPYLYLSRPKSSMWIEFPYNAGDTRNDHAQAYD